MTVMARNRIYLAQPRWHCLYFTVLAFRNSYKQFVHPYVNMLFYTIITGFCIYHKIHYSQSTLVSFLTYFLIYSYCQHEHSSCVHMWHPTLFHFKPEMINDNNQTEQWQHKLSHIFQKLKTMHRIKAAYIGINWYVKRVLNRRWYQSRIPKWNSRIICGRVEVPL